MTLQNSSCEHSSGPHLIHFLLQLLTPSSPFKTRPVRRPPCSGLLEGAFLLGQTRCLLGATSCPQAWPDPDQEQWSLLRQQQPLAEKPPSSSAREGTGPGSPLPLSPQGHGRHPLGQAAHGAFCTAWTGTHCPPLRNISTTHSERHPRALSFPLHQPEGSLRGCPAHPRPPLGYLRSLAENYFACFISCQFCILFPAQPLGKHQE